MQTRRGAAALLCGLTCWFLAARPEARTAGDGASSGVASTSGGVVSASSAIKKEEDEAAVREMLEGTAGRREAWTAAPSLVIETAVMDYRTGDLSSGFAALSEKLSDAELTQLTTDLTEALAELSGGTFKAFRTITVEVPQRGDVVKVIRPGQIVVGRFRGVQATTGNLGYGGRMTRNGTITGAAVVLDAAFDQQSDRRQLLRTHELGHALGFNHVESRPSFMNPHVGTSLTDFDRATIRQAFAETPGRR